MSFPYGNNGFPRHNQVGPRNAFDGLQSIPYGAGFLETNNGSAASATTAGANISNMVPGTAAGTSNTADVNNMMGFLSVPNQHNGVTGTSLSSGVGVFTSAKDRSAKIMSAIPTSVLSLASGTQRSRGNQNGIRAISGTCETLMVNNPGSGTGPRNFRQTNTSRLPTPPPPPLRLSRANNMSSSNTASATSSQVSFPSSFSSNGMTSSNNNVSTIPKPQIQSSNVTGTKKSEAIQIKMPDFTRRKRKDQVDYNPPVSSPSSPASSKHSSDTSVVEVVDSKRVF